jgi:hypothetical protein
MNGLTGTLEDVLITLLGYLVKRVSRLSGLHIASLVTDG